MPAPAKLGRRGAELRLPPRQSLNGARRELERNGVEPWRCRSGDWVVREASRQRRRGKTMCGRRRGWKGGGRVMSEGVCVATVSERRKGSSDRHVDPM
jgi:hypothetical protein